MLNNTQVIALILSLAFLASFTILLSLGRDVPGALLSLPAITVGYALGIHVGNGKS